MKAEEVTSVVVPPPKAETEITVVLEDINDQTPTFKNPHYVGEISEGSQFNSPVNLVGDAIPEVYDNDQVFISNFFFTFLYIFRTLSTLLQCRLRFTYSRYSIDRVEVSQTITLLLYIKLHKV